jgi:hypothetical protein
VNHGFRAPPSVRPPSKAALSPTPRRPFFGPTTASLQLVLFFYPRIVLQGAPQLLFYCKCLSTSGAPLLFYGEWGLQEKLGRRKVQTVWFPKVKLHALQFFLPNSMVELQVRWIVLLLLEEFLLLSQ